MSVGDALVVFESGVLSPVASVTAYGCQCSDLRRRSVSAENQLTCRSLQMLCRLKPDQIAASVIVDVSVTPVC